MSGKAPWLCALLALTFSAAEALGDGLPAEECVGLMRGARIARMLEDPAKELEKLQAAAEACPGEIAPIHALMGYFQRRPELEESYREFRALLLQRLQDPGSDLPVGGIEYLIRNPGAEKAELAAILGNVARQVEKSAEPEPALMRIQAQLQRRLGRDEAAVATLERLWRLGAADDLLWPLISLYSELERWSDAAELMAPEVEKDAQLRIFHIHILGKLGRFEELLQQVEILVSGTVVGGTAAGDDSEARALENEGGFIVDVVRQPGLLELMKQVAWDLRDQGKDEEAERIFRDLLAQAPDDPELQTTVLELYASEEERKGQAAALADAWRSETDANALFEEGTQRLTAGDAAGAIDLLRRAAPELPDLEAAWYNLGMAAYRLEDWTTVVSAFGRAAELNPSRAQTVFFRGLALEKLGRCKEAVADLERAVELDPDRALAHYYLAACHRELGNRAAAAAALERYEATRN